MPFLGIDVGGSGIKGALVDTETGQLVTERIRIPSPPTFQPQEVLATIQTLIEQLNYHGPVGVGFPAVVQDGIVMTPPTAKAFPNWEGINLAQEITTTTRCPTIVWNDADVAGLAEVTFGAGQGVSGVIMVFTLGTGIGSAMFVNGRLVPNLELGRLYLRHKKKTAEHLMSDLIRKQEDLSWEKWGNRLNKYFQYIELLFWPNLIIIGGGVSKKHDRFLPYIHTRTPITAAQLRNEAGLIGAALAAATILT
ncbi:MAG: ROK family protein [Chloroflexi bacterium]|nr:MAG: ROK family protein [Chloroflexota bacterium]